tara:strand:+ start:63442 stop:64473 length:1032 start_codon:yes stop_codon:yes gene_type:complete
LLGVVPITAIVLGGHYWVKSSRYVETENAYVKAHHLAVSADIDGRAIRVLVKENDRVKKGDLLFTLDPEPHRINVAKAEAELASIRNTLTALRAEYRQAVAERADARQEVSYFKRVFDRQRKLSARGVASRARYDEAERNLTKARQQARTLDQKILRVLARLGGKLDLPSQQHPMYLEAEASLHRAALDLRRTQVRAPAAGIVGKVSLQTGEYVEEGKAVIPIVQTNETWIEANLKETQLTYVKTGQSVALTVDAYPDVELVAKVSSISPSTGGELSVLPPQNASGNWVKVVQRVPVRIELLDKKKAPNLRAGMTVSVTIDTKRERSLFGVVSSALARIGSSD